MSKLPSDLSTVTTELPRNHRDNCVIPRNNLAALHVAKLSPSPLGEGLGWGI
jgi:hypothetical protein